MTSFDEFCDGVHLAISQHFRVLNIKRVASSFARFALLAVALVVCNGGRLQATENRCFAESGIFKKSVIHIRM